MLLSFESDSGGHSVQLSGPLRILKLPASQGTQTLPFGPVYPGLQVQFVDCALPAGESLRKTCRIESSSAVAMRMKFFLGYAGYNNKKGVILVT